MLESQGLLAGGGILVSSLAEQSLVLRKALMLKPGGIRSAKQLGTRLPSWRERESLWR
jgi:hypothetical protein